MYSSRLIQLLKSLDKHEFRLLGKFIKSSFFNSNEEVIRLYDYLKQNNYHPNFDAPALTKEQVDKKIFGKDNQAYNYQARRIRDCMSALSTLVKEFMIFQESHQKEDYIKDQLFLKSLYRRNLHKLFVSKTRELENKLKKQPIRDLNFYKLMFNLKHDHFFHADTIKLKLAAEKVNEVMSNLDRFYVSAKLRLSCELRSREQILSEVYEIELMDEAIQLATHKYALSDTLFSIYANLLQLFSGGFEEDTYLETKALYFDHLDKIGKKEQKIILHYLINIMSGAINKKAKNIKEVFSLYQIGLQHKILILNNRITPESFSNIAILGSNLEAFDWTFNFINNYGAYLDESVRKDTKLISLAYWHFNKKEYDKTLDLIDRQQAPGKVFNIRTRALLIRTYLEKFLEDSNFFNLLSSTTESFRKQVERNDLISESKKMSYKNFLKCINQIAKLVRNNPTTFEQKIQRIKTDLQTKDKIISRSWLLQKVESLEKK